MDTMPTDACAIGVRATYGRHGRPAPFGVPELSVSPTDPNGAASKFSLRKAGVIHDLRNLLQVAASALQLIDREADRGAAANVHRLTKSGLRAIDRAAALSRAILDAAPTTAASVGLVDVGDTIAAMRDLTSLTAGRSVVIDFLVEGGVPPVRCDRGELEDVLLNLVANARDAMPNGGSVTISLSRRISAANSADGRPGVVLRVDDTGHGMPDATRRQAFTPFFTTKPAGRGTGLGLAMVSDFATRVGGSVEIESAVGEGTSVILCLPSTRP